MGKFGKKVNVSTDLSNYMIGIMGPSGFGKTTLMYQICEKEFGPDGYIILDMSAEDGVAALQGATAEKVTTWKKMKEVVDDIVKNKDTDYPDLKVVILDTLDAAFEAAEIWTVDTYNRENMGKQGFTKASSINGVEGGFGRGLEKCIENVKKEIARLRNVGVGVYWTAHVKEKDQVDLFTGANYTTLTANMSMKYFSSIQNSSHIVAFGYFDRSIEKQAVGDVNPITKKAKERKTVLGESRRVKFRDDAMIADAKSRFSEIVDEIDLDADEFIKAIKDAIEAERNKGGVTASKKTKKVKPAPVVEPEPIEEIDELEEDEAPFDTVQPVEEAEDEDDDLFDDEPDFDAIRTQIRNLHKAGTKEQKAQVKAILAGRNLNDIDDLEVLDEIICVFN